VLNDARARAAVGVRWRYYKMKYKTLIVDLDATLVHTIENSTMTASRIPSLASFIVQLEGNTQPMLVYIRPYAPQFLAWAFLNYKVIFWTAATRQYALAVLQGLLTPSAAAAAILFSRQTTEICEKLTGHHKLISFISNYIDEEPALIIDDRQEVYNSQPLNAYRIAPFIANSLDSGADDRELVNLTVFLHLNDGTPMP
jgi:TFIIF-interacting CTD phosphatase-like protein